MKKLLAIVLVFVSMFSYALADENTTETVVQMTYIVKLPDVIREGLYTGEVLNNLPHGYGVFTTTNANGISWHYLGEWVNGEMSGQGGQYWDHGQSTVGTFEKNNMICGEVHTTTSKNGWYDYTPNEKGLVHVKEYRTDGSIYFDGYIDAVTAQYVEGDVYTKDGKLFFSGKIGDGFNWNLIYVE